MAVHVTPEALKEAVIEALRDGEKTPSDLIDALTRQKNLFDADIRVAIWYLISQNELELSAEQKLRLASAG